MKPTRAFTYTSLSYSESRLFSTCFDLRRPTQHFSDVFPSAKIHGCNVSGSAEVRTQVMFSPQVNQNLISDQTLSEVELCTYANQDKMRYQLHIEQSQVGTSAPPIPTP
jgi:hypothetical protein